MFDFFLIKLQFFLSLFTPFLYNSILIKFIFFSSLKSFFKFFSTDFIIVISLIFVFNCVTSQLFFYHNRTTISFYHRIATSPIFTTLVLKILIFRFPNCIIFWLYSHILSFMMALIFCNREYRFHLSFLF